MAETKTKSTTQSISEFISSLPANRQADAATLVEIFKKATGEKPIIWGTNIIGFGTYHYKSPSSNREGEWMQVAFSPRKQNFTLYVGAGNNNVQKLLPALGKCKTSGGCLYINKLADVDLQVLTELIKLAFSNPKTSQV